MDCIKRLIGKGSIAFGILFCLIPSLLFAQGEWVTRWTFFDPMANGWQFANDQFKVCAAPTCIPENTVGDFGHTFLQARWALCGGMSLSALRRFKEGRDIEPYSAYLKDHELVPAQLDVVESYWRAFVEWDSRPDLPQPPLQPHSMRHETRQEWQTVKAAIDVGAPILLGLILVKQTGDPTKIFDDHIVLAVGYSYNSTTKEAKVYVYDSRDPRTVQTISLLLDGPTLDLRFTHPEAVFRGFFAMSNDSGPPRGAPASYFVPCSSLD